MLKKNNILKDSAILTINDYERIKRNSRFMSVNNSFNPEKSNDENLDIRHVKAAELKKKILDYDLTHREEAKSSVLSKSPSMVIDPKNSIEKGDDCVKAMDKLILYAKIATIRDRQLEEKKRLEDIYKKKEEKVEIMMEIERLKEISSQENRDKEIKRQRKEGCKTIIGQIKEREIERIKQKNLLLKEGKEINQHRQFMEEEEKKQTEILKKKNEIHYKEALAANEAAITERMKKKLQEKEYDLKLFEYQLEKERLDDEKIREKKLDQEQKEKELQKMRDKQEKSKDKLSELDAIRSKRAFEFNERKERERMASELVLKSRRIKEFLTTNNKQILDKEMKLAEESEKERLNFEKIVEKQQKDLDEEKKNKEEYRKRLYQHNFQLRRQIKEKEERNQLDKIEKLDEGMKIKFSNEIYHKNLQKIKDDKIKQLSDMKFDPKYLVDLQKFKIKKD